MQSPAHCLVTTEVPHRDSLCTEQDVPVWLGESRLTIAQALFPFLPGELRFSFSFNYELTPGLCWVPFHVLLRRLLFCGFQLLLPTQMETSGLLKRQVSAEFYGKIWFSVSCLLPMPGCLGSIWIRYALRRQPVCFPLEEPDKILVYSLVISYCHREESHRAREHYYTRGIVCSGVGPGGVGTWLAGWSVTEVIPRQFSCQKQRWYFAR